MHDRLKHGLATAGLLVSAFLGMRGGETRPSAVEPAGGPTPVVSTQTGISSNSPTSMQTSSGNNPPSNPSSPAKTPSPREFLYAGPENKRKGKPPYLVLEENSLIRRIAVAQDGTTILLTPRYYYEKDTVKDALQDALSFKAGEMWCVARKNGNLAILSKDRRLPPVAVANILYQAELIQRNDAELVKRYLESALKLKVPESRLG